MATFINIQKFIFKRTKTLSFHRIAETSRAMYMACIYVYIVRGRNDLCGPGDVAADGCDSDVLIKRAPSVTKN